MSKKILVMMGGFSAEREVSLVTGKGVAKALEQRGYDVLPYDLNNVRDFIDTIERFQPDAVFNALHGNFGEDGTIQGLLDLMQVPYTHSGLLASAVGMNKFLTKILCEFLGIKVAASEKMTVAEFMKKGTVVSMPYVIKPVSDGSSVGVYIIRQQEDLKNVVYDDENTEVLIEKFIPGKELTCMVLDGRAYVITELKTKEEFYDYKAKYTDGVTFHELPAEIPEDASETCKRYAVKLHNKLGCNTVSRCDFRYNPDDGVVLLEINTHPGMTPLSLVPEQCKYAGISYEELCEKLVENATCRKLPKIC